MATTTEIKPALSSQDLTENAISPTFWIGDEKTTHKITEALEPRLKRHQDEEIIIYSLGCGQVFPEIEFAPLPQVFDTDKFRYFGFDISRVEIEADQKELEAIKKGEKLQYLALSPEILTKIQFEQKDLRIAFGQKYPRPHLVLIRNFAVGYGEDQSWKTIFRNGINHLLPDGLVVVTNDFYDEFLDSQDFLKSSGLQIILEGRGKYFESFFTLALKTLFTSSQTTLTH